jgi:hypothetical protein
MDDDLERAADERFDLEGLGPVPVPTPEPFWQRLGRGGGLLLALVAFVLVGIALLMVRRQRRIEGLSVAERVYQDLVNWVRRLLQISPLAHQTPSEYAMVVADVMPQGRAAVEQIADLYVRERFGGKDVPGDEAETAWSEVRPALWRRWVRRQGERWRDSRFNLFPARPTQRDWTQMDTRPEE